MFIVAVIMSKVDFPLWLWTVYQWRWQIYLQESLENEGYRSMVRLSSVSDSAVVTCLSVISCYDHTSVM